MVAFGAVASSTAAARAAGVRAARAPIVAFVEDHCFPQQGWAAALIAAHREPWAAVGPAIGNANPDSAVSWANLLIEYSPWMEPATAGAVEHLPGHNSSYKRNVLLGVWSRSRDHARNREHHALGPAREGFCPASGTGSHQPALELHHDRSLRCVCASTADGCSLPRAPAAGRLRARIAYAAAAPLIPLIRLRRILAQVWRRRGATLPTSAFPALTLLLVCDAAGEMAGYLLGAGAEAQRGGEFEFHVDRRATGGGPT